MQEPDIRQIADDTSPGEEGFYQNVENEYTTWQVEREEAITKDIAQATSERRNLGRVLGIVVPIWLIAVFITVIVDGASSKETFDLDQSVVLALISSTTAWMGLLIWTVVNFLLRARAPEGR